MQSVKELEFAALNIRKDLLRLCTMEVIHIGGDLSVADVMTALWQYKMRYDPQKTEDESRDRFILSKSHASAVTSFNQAAVGCFQKEDIYREYAKDNGRFSMHSCNLINPFVEISTGSLGHGLPIACGIAKALRLKKNRTSRVYVVMGDGEQAEGSIWEAAMNAAHYKLGNLVAILDNNGFSIDGSLDELTGIGNISEKYSAFGWNVVEIDGNDMQQIIWALDDLPSPESEQPTVLVCHTIKGRGVSFMENDARWHAGKISEDDYNKAAEALDREFYDKWGIE